MPPPGPAAARTRAAACVAMQKLQARCGAKVLCRAPSAYACTASMRVGLHDLGCMWTVWVEQGSAGTCVWSVWHVCGCVWRVRAGCVMQPRQPRWAWECMHVYSSNVGWQLCHLVVAGRPGCHGAGTWRRRRGEGCVSMRLGGWAAPVCASGCVCVDCMAVLMLPNGSAKRRARASWPSCINGWRQGVARRRRRRRRRRAERVCVWVRRQWCGWRVVCVCMLVH